MYTSRYKKVLRSKDLSSARSEDLDCVFGRRGSKRERRREREVEVCEGGEDEEEEEVEGEGERGERRATKMAKTSEHEVCG